MKLSNNLCLVPSLSGAMLLLPAYAFLTCKGKIYILIIIIIIIIIIMSCPCIHITHLIQFSAVGLAYPAAIPPSARNWRSLETARVEPVTLKAPIYQRASDPVISLSGVLSHFVSGN